MVAIYLFFILLFCLNIASCVGSVTYNYYDDYYNSQKYLDDDSFNNETPLCFINIFLFPILLLFLFISYCIVLLFHDYVPIVRAKWKSTDPQKRKEAIEELTDEKILKKIVKKDKNNEVKCVALNKMTNYDLIKRFLNKKYPLSLRVIASKKVIKSLERTKKVLLLNNEEQDVKDIALKEIEKEILIVREDIASIEREHQISEKNRIEHEQRKQKNIEKKIKHEKALILLEKAKHTI